MPAADRIRDLSRWPIVVSPMAGGPTGPALVIAAARAGALPFLAAGNKTPTAMEAEIDAVRGATDSAFGVNVFVPGKPTEDAAALTAYLGSLEADAAALGAELGAAAWDDDGFDEKLERLLADPPPVVSFTFGCPPADAVQAFQSKGVVVVITVTTPDEAVLALRAGADSLCLQGSEAGGHRGTFANGDGADQDYPLLELLSRVRGQTDVPLIAAGGIAGPDDVATVLAAGAVAAQAGTAFLRCSESGANSTYQRALGRSPIHLDRHHPRLQWPTGPRSGQPVHAGARGGAQGVSGDQQRHPAAAGRRGCLGRPRLHEFVCRREFPPGRDTPGR